MMNTNTLIVYWEENVHFYLIPDSDLTDEQVKILEKAAGKMVNTDTYNEAPEALDYITVALSSKAEYCNGEPHACIWHRYKIDEGAPVHDLISRVILTGFAP